MQWLRRRRWWQKALLVTGAILALLIAIGSVLPSEEEGRTSTAADPAPTEGPTLTPAELAFVAAVATGEAEERAASTETAAAKPTNTPRPTATPKPPPYKLALISASCTHSYSIMECEGFVRNLSGESLEAIQVYVEWVDADGTPQASDWSFVDYDPLLPGQESPWTVYGDYNPALTRYRVTFREFMGGALLTRDDR